MFAMAYHVFVFTIILCLGYLIPNVTKCNSRLQVYFIGGVAFTTGCRYLGWGRETLEGEASVFFQMDCGDVHPETDPRCPRPQSDARWKVVVVGGTSTPEPWRCVGKTTSPKYLKLPACPLGRPTYRACVCQYQCTFYYFGKRYENFPNIYWPTTSLLGGGALNTFSSQLFHSGVMPSGPLFLHH